MSSCCDTKTQNQENLSSKQEKEPTNFFKRLLWKIGKADHDKNMKNSEDKKSCCS